MTRCCALDALLQPLPDSVLITNHAACALVAPMSVAVFQSDSTGSGRRAHPRFRAVPGYDSPYYRANKVVFASSVLRQLNNTSQVGLNEWYDGCPFGHNAAD